MVRRPPKARARCPSRWPKPRSRTRRSMRAASTRSSSAVSAAGTRSSATSWPKPAVLRDVELQYVLTGKGRKRPARAAGGLRVWSDQQQEWTVAHRAAASALKWRPGRRPLAFKVLSPGIKAKHVKGTGAERLMFSFTRDNETLKVLRAEVSGLRQRADEKPAVGRCGADRQADRLSTFHRGHVRSGVRERRQGLPDVHGAQGDRGAARGESPSGLSRESCSRIPSRCRSSPRSR